MLKALILRKKIDDKKKLLEALQQTATEFVTRETELEQAIAEVTTEEEQAAVEESVNAFEAEKRDNTEKIATYEAEILSMETELAKIEEKQRAIQPNPTPKKERGYGMKAFFGLDAQERTAFFENREVKEVLQQVRTAIKEKRSITGASLTIPEVMLDLIRQTIPTYSKLLKHTHHVTLSGKGRQNIMGVIPEAVWTEACGKLNELNLVFNNVEIDGYKVGGYFAICNATLEDSDLNLASELINAISQSIAYALDKAILYGTGKKMPLGIVTRLAQSAKPETYPETAREWQNLSTTHLLATEATDGIAFYKELVTASGVLDSDYSRGNLFWAMNKKTYTKLLSCAMSISLTGTIVSGQTSVMPVIGGNIETLNFIPDDVIIGGYGDLYLLAERSGVKLAQSEHARFIEDQTVFKGTARYDGTPVIPEAFLALSIGGSAPTADMTFASDTANGG